MKIGACWPRTLNRTSIPEVVHEYMESKRKHELFIYLPLAMFKTIAFLSSFIWVKMFAMFDVKFGFSWPNSILYQLERFGNTLREFGLCTLPSSELRTSARSETSSGSALPKVQARAILLKCYVFQHFYRKRGPGARFFHQKLEKTCCHCSGATCVRWNDSQWNTRASSKHFFDKCMFLCPCQARLHSLL